MLARLKNHIIIDINKTRNLEVQASYASLSRLAARRGDQWYLRSHLFKSHFERIPFLLLEIKKQIWYLRSHLLKSHFKRMNLFCWRSRNRLHLWKSHSLKWFFFFCSRSRNRFWYLRNHTSKGFFFLSSRSRNSFWWKELCALTPFRAAFEIDTSQDSVLMSDARMVSLLKNNYVDDEAEVDGEEELRSN